VKRLSAKKKNLLNSYKVINDSNNDDNNNNNNGKVNSMINSNGNKVANGFLSYSNFISNKQVSNNNNSILDNEKYNTNGFNNDYEDNKSQAEKSFTNSKRKKSKEKYLDYVQSDSSYLNFKGNQLNGKYYSLIINC